MRARAHWRPRWPEGWDKHGRSVAIITNDQGDALVDTEFMKSAGIDVREVLGGCFCSHSMSSSRAPTVWSRWNGPT